jgi:hypothetical protein
MISDTCTIPENTFEINHSCQYLEEASRNILCSYLPFWCEQYWEGYHVGPNAHFQIAKIYIEELQAL